MKRLFPIFILTLILTHVAGFYVYFYFRLREIKKEMQAELVRSSPELLTRIVLTLEEYNLHKRGDDELKLNNTMYDIVNIAHCNESLEIFVLEDEAETNLLLLMSKIVQAASHDSKTPPHSLFQFFGLSFIVPSNSTSPEIHFTDHPIYRTDYFESLSAPDLRQPTPPPRS